MSPAKNNLSSWYLLENAYDPMKVADLHKIHSTTHQDDRQTSTCEGQNHNSLKYNI